MSLGRPADSFYLLFIPIHILLSLYFHSQDFNVTERMVERMVTKVVSN